MQDKFTQSPKLYTVTYHAGLLGMVLVLLMTFAFASNGLNTDVIWTDELTSLGHMGAFDPPYDPSQIINSIADKSSQHMPLFFVLGAGWAHVAGWSQLSLRLISALAGVLFVAWVYRFGEDFINRRTGIIASALLGSSAFMVVYMHEIRMYSLFMMLAVMHTWLYWRLAHHRQVTRLTWLLFVLTTSALFYTHIFSTVLFAGLGIYHLIIVRKSRHWLLIILGWVVGAVLFLPYVPTVIKGFTLATNKVSTFTTALSTPELIDTLIYLLTNGLSLLLIPLIGLLVLALWRTRNHMVLRFAFVAGLMFVTLVLINERFGLVPLRRARYLLILWFPFLLLLSYGLANTSRWLVATGIFMTIWFVTGWQVYRLPSFIDYSANMRVAQMYPPMQDYVFQLQGNTQPQDYLVGFTFLDYVNAEGKLGKSPVDYYMEAQLNIDGIFIPTRSDAGELEVEIPKKLSNHPYLLLTYNPVKKPQNFDMALAMIQLNYMACDVIVDQPELFVQRYVGKMLGCEHEYAPIIYENGVIIVDKFAQYDSEANTVRILTGWDVFEEQLLYEYNVSFQILTPDWQKVEQVDFHLYDILSWKDVELSVKNLDTGDYRIMVIVYHRDTGEKVTGTDEISNETGDILPIMTFSIKSD